jgi:hypothetical protein
MDALFFLLLLVGASLLWLSRRWASDAGLSQGRLVSVDLERDGRAAPTLVDPELGLSGRPDALLETRRGWTPVEIKSGSTVAPDMLAGLQRWMDVAGTGQSPTLIYGGSEAYIRQGISVRPWFAV